MSAIKRTPADAAFSDCVRSRANWTCERCGTKHEMKSQGLHCSHFFSRGNWEIRFDPLNAEALCYGCHMLEGGTGRLSRAIEEILREKMQDRNLGREARKTKGKGEIAKHYREELKRIEKLRSQGQTGRIEFLGYF